MVINELDAISNGGRNFAEFIEIKNVGGTAINLGNYYLNLTTMLADPAPASYRDPVQLVDFILNPGEYFVICATPATVPLCKVYTTLSPWILFLYCRMITLVAVGRRVSGRRLAQ